MDSVLLGICWFLTIGGMIGAAAIATFLQFRNDAFR
ncbi:hypothetical protein QBC99_000573 [Beijerinckia sp. GAS462]|nr:hypothetical protein [Beijerinckia sp. GAS462]SEB64795.1 hypothetical protein SAMN05443249_0781 [Beijerinckia sp. 28-YEA-48]